MKTGEQSHNQTLKSARYYVHSVWHIFMWPIKIDQKCRVTGSRSYIRLGKKTICAHGTVEWRSAGIWDGLYGWKRWCIMACSVRSSNCATKCYKILTKASPVPLRSTHSKISPGLIKLCIALADFCDKTLRSKRLRWYRESIFHFYFLPK